MTRLEETAPALSAVRHRILEGLQARLDAAAVSWLAGATDRVARGTRRDLLTAYTVASRYLGRAPLTRAETAAGSGPAAVATGLDDWRLEDAGRLLLLLARFEAAPTADAFYDDAMACYEQGDAREQESWVRGAALLPNPQRFLALMIDTCRTNILPLFEAVACHNPYPARFFPDRNFNQMVLKALFNGVALARITDLAARANPQLARMALDYASERRAAGRSIPADIGLATADPAARRSAV